MLLAGPLMLAAALGMGTIFVVLAYRIVRPRTSTITATFAAAAVAASLVAIEVSAALTARRVAAEPVATSARISATSLADFSNGSGISAALELAKYPTLKYIDARFDAQLHRQRPEAPYNRMPTGFIRYENARRRLAGEPCRPDEILRRQWTPGPAADVEFCIGWRAVPRVEADFALGQRQHAEWRGLHRVAVRSHFLRRRADGAEFNELREVAVSGGPLWWAAHWLPRILGIPTNAAMAGYRAETIDSIRHLAPGDPFVAAGRYIIEGQR